ncbi:alpha/beta fold hydrolase [Paeniglutamicibacter sp. NPDC012692]|uniref:alpha/beta fold hydrolase n=1 Tax=Paeniglutamicibacter sp. NPDC012692 TaxID=3364388 RepID=UPI003688B60B
MKPQQELWAELPDGTRLAYSAVGQEAGNPVLLLHAWGESRRSFGRLMPLLPPTMRAMSIDLRGHGDSGKPPRGYSLDGMAADVVGFMDAIGLESAILLGSSSGGYVAQQAAVTAPDRVAGLVLVGSPRSLLVRPGFADEVEALVDPVDPEWVRRSLPWFPCFTPVPQEYIDDRVRDGANIPAHVWIRTLNGLCGAKPPTDAGIVACPTLILWGGKDSVLSRAQQDGLVAGIPGSRLVVYGDTGHLVLWEQPGRIAEDVAAFLAALE